MSDANKASWIELAAFTNACWNATPPIQIDNTSFVRCPSKSSDKYIHKYNTETNQWDESIAYPKDLKDPIRITAAFDQQKQILYIYSDVRMVQIDIVKNTSTITTLNTKEIGGTARGLIANNQFHLIGGTDNKSHLIWDDEKKLFDEIYEFPVVEFIAHPGFIHIKSKNILLLLGGYDNNEGLEYDLDTIYSYDISKKKWTLLPHKLPVELSYFGCILSANEKSVVIMGGTSVEDDHQLDTIYVLNTETMEFKLSNVRCPRAANYYAINMADREKSELITFGYIRDIWNAAEFCNVPYPPDELIKLMGCFYCTEYIYLLDEDGEHWKMELSDILQNCEE